MSAKLNWDKARKIKEDLPRRPLTKEEDYENLRRRAPRSTDPGRGPQKKFLVSRAVSDYREEQKRIRKQQVPPKKKRVIKPLKTEVNKQDEHLYCMQDFTYKDLSERYDKKKSRPLLQEMQKLKRRLLSTCYDGEVLDFTNRSRGK